jgi:hypothetical protein
LKIAYVLDDNLDASVGVKEKVKSQMEVWEKSGVSVQVMEIATGRVSTLRDLQNERAAPTAAVDRGRKALYASGRAIGRISRIRHLANKVEDFAPEIIYSRYTLPVPGLTGLMRKAPILVFEINSNDLREYWLAGKLKGFANAALRRRLLGQAAGMVFVTRELSNMDSFSWYGGPRLILGNGIDVAAHEYVEAPGNPQPWIGFVGYARQTWNGLDKIRAIARVCPDSLMHLVGMDAHEYEQNWGVCERNMRFYGRLSTRETASLMARMDVGLSTLSSYERRLSEGCPLKSRQYFAHGVPVIGGYADPDVVDQPFYLQLPNTPDNVSANLAGIRQFVAGAHGNVDLRRQTREFAERVLDVGIKEKRRLEFFARCGAVDRDQGEK